VAPRSKSGSHPGRALAALGVLVLIMLFSITAKQTFSPSDWHSRFKVGLGLDLSSGTKVTLQAATPNGTTPSAGSMQQAISVLQARVNGTGSSGAQVQQTGGNLITVTVPGQSANGVINELDNTAKLAFRQVLLEEPYSPSASATPSASASASPSASANATSTSTAKASASATATATASPAASSTASPKASGQDVSAVQATPSASASTTASGTASPTATASSTAKASASPSASASASPTTAVSQSLGNSSLVNAATQKLFNKLVCTPGGTDAAWQKSVGYTTGGDQWDKPADQTVACDSSGNKYVLGPAAVLGTQVSSANAALDTTSGQWIINISLNGQATKTWGTLTTHLYNTYYQGAQSGDQNDSVLDETALVLGGDVQQAPQTDGALTTGQFEINGGSTGFSQAQADSIANLLKYGQLPLSFSQQDAESISPEQGSSSLQAGLIAGILGLGLVIIYLFYYYRGLGLVSVSSLLIAAGLAYGSVVLLSLYQNFTMSLSAIAGLVVAIGITADSFIVYFERLRDEVRDGKTLRPAVEAGWKRARRTILVSDTVSFIAAVLLYHFAVSDVQGFAYTLGLTTLIDVLVVFLFTKPMVTLLAGTKFFSSGHKWSGLDPERLGAKARWRASTRRTVRTQRTSSPRTSSAGTPSADATSKES
jgi:preprotein translocase subunit SecD